ncbi:MAG TPA: hypothetical protein VLE46_12630 [Nitrospira sp.]|nr:hypothetical protein [Nitrospira sp.]
MFPPGDVRQTGFVPIDTEVWHLPPRTSGKWNKPQYPIGSLLLFSTTAHGPIPDFC